MPTDINGDFAFTPLDGDTGLLPYDDSSVDVALMIDVLEHVEQPETVLSEIARILRPDGKMLAFVPIEGEPISWFSLFRAILGQDLYVRTKDHINSFTHDHVERMLAARFDVDRAPLPLPLLRAVDGRGAVRRPDARPGQARVLDPQPLPRREQCLTPAVARRSHGRDGVQGGQPRRLDSSRAYCETSGPCRGGSCSRGASGHIGGAPTTTGD